MSAAHKVIETTQIYIVDAETQALTPYLTRPITKSLVKNLLASIQEKGYYKYSPLLICRRDNKQYVICGNHRLEAAKEAGIEKLPCVVENIPESEWFKVAIRDNEINNTLKPDDLFDWLYRIELLKKEDLTQTNIGKRIGWSESMVKQYGTLLNKIVTQVLDLAKQHQKTSVTEKVTNVTFNFTEGWFRTSGLYELCEHYQLRFMKEFENKKFAWTKERVQKETAKHKRWQEYIEIAKKHLLDPDDLDAIIELIEKDIYKTKEQLLGKIASLNEKKKHKFGLAPCYWRISFNNTCSLNT